MHPKLIFILILLLLMSRGLSAQEENILNPSDTVPGQSIDINIDPQTHFNLGGAIWMRSAIQDWRQDNKAN
jgi:hypothetical protein